LLFTLGILVATAVLGSRAEAQNYPWCAVYNEDGPASNCGFITIEQCRATVSGIGGSCERNDWYKPPVSAPAQQLGHKSHTHS